MDTIACGFWLVIKENIGSKNFMPEKFLEISWYYFDVILQHGWPIEQGLLHITLFFGRKKKSPRFDLFWLIKQITNTCQNHFPRSYKNCSIRPYSRTSCKQPPKTKRLGDRSRKVFAYESQTATAKFLSQPRMECYIYYKKIMKVYFPLPNTDSFIDKIMSYSTWQFFYRSALKDEDCGLKILLMYVTSYTEMSLKRLMNKNLTSYTETGKSKSFSQGQWLIL